MNYLAFNIGDIFFNDTDPDHFLKNITDVGTLMSLLLSNAIIIAGIVLIFIIVIAGIQMISGSGDTQKVGQARQILTVGILGFVIIVAAFFIVRLLESTLGLSIIG